MDGYKDGTKGCAGCNDGKEKEGLFKCFNLLSVAGYLRLDELVARCKECVDKKKQIMI